MFWFLKSSVVSESKSTIIPGMEFLIFFCQIFVAYSLYSLLTVVMPIWRGDNHKGSLP